MEELEKKRLRLAIPDEDLKDFSRFRHIKVNLNGHKKHGKNHYRIQLRKIGKTLGK